MNKHLKNVKEDIRALILSANDGLSITQLEKDYFVSNSTLLLKFYPLIFDISNRISTDSTFLSADMVTQVYWPF